MVLSAASKIVWWAAAARRTRAPAHNAASAIKRPWRSRMMLHAVLVALLACVHARAQIMQRRQQSVREMFLHAWKGYKDHAWGELSMSVDLYVWDWLSEWLSVCLCRTRYVTIYRTSYLSSELSRTSCISIYLSNLSISLSLTHSHCDSTFSSLICVSGRDELRPQSKTGFDWLGSGLGATIVDSMSTMWIMGLQQEFDEAREWIDKNLSEKIATVRISIHWQNGGQLSTKNNK